jgi:Flp pilus assembly pilin Flp
MSKIENIKRMLEAFLISLLSRLPVLVVTLLWRFHKNRKGITALVIALVVSLVALGILIPVGLLVTSNIKTTVDSMDLGTQGNATRLTLFTNIFQGYNLAAIIPIIAAAGIIISVIIGAFAFRQGKQ